MQHPNCVLIDGVTHLLTGYHPDTCRNVLEMDRRRGQQLGRMQQAERLGNHVMVTIWQRAAAQTTREMAHTLEVRMRFLPPPVTPVSAQGDLIFFPSGATARYAREEVRS